MLTKEQIEELEKEDSVFDDVHLKVIDVRKKLKPHYTMHLCIQVCTDYDIPDSIYFDKYEYCYECFISVEDSRNNKEVAHCLAYLFFGDVDTVRDMADSITQDVNGSILRAIEADTDLYDYINYIELSVDDDIPSFLYVSCLEVDEKYRRLNIASTVLSHLYRAIQKSFKTDTIRVYVISGFLKDDKSAKRVADSFYTHLRFFEFKEKGKYKNKFFAKTMYYGDIQSLQHIKGE